MIIARTATEECFRLFTKNLKRRKATVKQYQMTSSERDPQGVTSAQPPAPPHKEAPPRKGEGQKKEKTTKPGQREPR